MANLARRGARNPKVKAYAETCETCSVTQSQASPTTIADHRAIAGSGTFETVHCLDSALRSVFHYRDEIEEIVRTPAFMIADLEEFGYLEGDCDDIATLAAAMTKSLDIPTRLTAMQSTPDGEFDHVFSEARIGTHWIPIDPTVAEGTIYQIYSVMTEIV